MNPLVNFKDPNLRVLISPKNMRIIALGIAIYQVILSHATLFLVFLGVLHAEEINKMLVSDIADEKEMNEYTVMPNVQEETLNQIRFKSAQELASLTIMSLYAAFVATAIYLLSSMCLLKGILRNRPNLMIPWMVVNGIGMFLLVAFWLTGGMSSALPQCVEPFYRLSCITVFTLDMVIWFMIRHYYLSLARDKKLTDQLVESATVKIPIQKKEKIIEGNDGYKHHLTDPLMVKIN